MHIINAEWWTGQWLLCINTPIIHPHLHLFVKNMSFEAQLLLGKCKAFFAWSSKGLGISLLARSQSKINSSTFKEEGDWSDKHVWMSDTLLRHFWCTVLAEEQEYRNSSLVPFYLSIFIRLSSSVQQCPVSICLDPDANHFDAPFFGHLTHLCHIWQTLVTKVELSHAQWPGLNFFSVLCPMQPGCWLDSMRFKSDPIWL